MTDTVSQNVDLTRFEITSDGSLAGFTQYVEAGLQRIFFHTEIGEEFGGRGLAAVLVTAALDATRDAGAAGGASVSLSRSSSSAMRQVPGSRGSGDASGHAGRARGHALPDRGRASGFAPRVGPVVTLAQLRVTSRSGP